MERDFGGFYLNNETASKIIHRRFSVLMMLASKGVESTSSSITFIIWHFERDLLMELSVTAFIILSKFLVNRKRELTQE